MNRSQTPSRTGVWLSLSKNWPAYTHGHMQTHTYMQCPTLHEGHRCWRRPLCVSALAGTPIGCQDPGQHACSPPPAAPQLPPGWGSRPPPSGSLEHRYWSSAGEGGKEEWVKTQVKNHVCKLVTMLIWMRPEERRVQREASFCSSPSDERATFAAGRKTDNHLNYLRRYYFSAWKQLDNGYSFQHQSNTALDLSVNSLWPKSEGFLFLHFKWRSTCSKMILNFPASWA